MWWEFRWHSRRGLGVTPKPGDQINLPIGVQIVFDAIKQESAAAQARAQILGKALADQNLGTDPNYVVSGEHYEDYNHQQLYDFAQAINTEGLHSARNLWDTQGTKISTLASDAATKVLTCTAHGAWVGASGDAMRAAVAALEKAGIQLGSVCTSVGVRLEAAGYAAEATRIAVPAPKPASKPDPDDPHSSAIPGVANPATLDAEQTARNQAELQAQAAFNNIYRPGVWTSGDQVPAFTQVSKPGQDGGANGEPGAAGPGDSSGKPDSGLPVSAESGSPQNPTDTAQGAGGKQSGDSDSSSAEGSTSDESSSGDNAATTNPAEADKTTTAGTTTQPGQAAAGTPGTSSPGPSGGSAGGVHGGGTPGSPIAGKSVPGLGNSASPTVALGGGPAGASRQPMMPLGGMPGATGRGKDEESAHKSPEYLRRVAPDWTEGITAYPGVFGSDAPAALPTPESAVGEPSPRPISIPVSEPAASRLPNPQPASYADNRARTVPASQSSAAAPVEPSPAPAAEPEPTQPPVSATDVSGLLQQFSTLGPFGPAEDPVLSDVAQPGVTPESEPPTPGPTTAEGQR